jgi:hypothetical protein
LKDVWEHFWTFFQQTPLGAILVFFLPKNISFGDFLEKNGTNFVCIFFCFLFFEIFLEYRAPKKVGFLGVG